MPKFRIVYTITEDPVRTTEKEALENLDAMSDDVDEFAMNASGKVVATLQRWVPMPTRSLPKNGQWENVKTIEQ